MKVSELWLREWVNPALTVTELASTLTMAGLEVDSVHPVAGAFDRVVVASVLQTTPHPQADKLTLCQVDAGLEAPLQIVCGAANVRAGLKVALAMMGAQLPGDIHIKETRLRGELSQGMLCSVTELGLDERADGIWELDADAPVGMDLRAYLRLNDAVLDIELTPNRADCLSMRGIAREVAAITNTPWQDLAPVTIPPHIDDSIPIVLQAPDACPLYSGRVIRGINPQATTPLWLKERLRRAGIRAIHPVVDVTNYVMLEYGQPMHAFDLNTIQGRIQVRYSTANEPLVLLDGQSVVLDANVLVIADDEKPLAMAGVMGGHASAVTADTTEVWIESAYFNPLVISGVARRYGISSDAAMRFERGIDPAQHLVALERATALLIDIVGGHVGPVTSGSHAASLPPAISVAFDPKQVMRLTGVALSDDVIATILTRLGFLIASHTPVWTVHVPSFRVDIHLDVDLVEEVIRVHGYDNIVSQPIIAPLCHGALTPQERLSMQMATFLSTRGYHEAISYSFVDPQLQEAMYPDTPSLPLLNPISSDLSVMRVGLWPGLMASMIYNLHRQQTAIKLFEQGVVFDVRDGHLQERACIAALLTGEQGTLNWSEPTRRFDFYDLKGDIQALCASLGSPSVAFVPMTHPSLHPGQSARVMINEEPAGWIGVLHPQFMDELDLRSDVILVELSLQACLDSKPIRYQSISKYPQIRRDLALLVDKTIDVAAIEASIWDVEEGAHYLKALDVFDVYTGPSLAVEKKSIAIAMTLQDDKKTLLDTEINSVITAIIKKLDREFTITLRD